MLANIDWLSAAILVILVADLVLGFRRGLIRQVFDLVGIIVAVLAAIRFGPDVSSNGLECRAGGVGGRFVIVLLGTLVQTDCSAMSASCEVPGCRCLTTWALCSVVRMILISVAEPAVCAATAAVDSAIAGVQRSRWPVAGILWNGSGYIPDHLGHLA